METRATRVITPLPQEEWGIIKFIRISKNNIDGRNINADIVYVRSLSGEYKMKETPKSHTAKEEFDRLLYGIPQDSFPSDKFDMMIMDMVKQKYPDAKTFNKLMILNVEKEDMQYIKQHPHSIAAIYVFPNISINNMQLASMCRVYQKSLDIYVDWFNSDDFNNEGFNLYYSPDKRDEVNLLMQRFDIEIKKF